MTEAWQQRKLYHIYHFDHVFKVSIDGQLLGAFTTEADAIAFAERAVSSYERLEGEPKEDADECR